MRKTAYQILGLAQSASADEIRSAYRKLALKHHPDRSDDPKSVEIFISITEAYNRLNDTDRRRAYDRSLTPPAAQTHERRAAPTQPRPEERRQAEERRTMVATEVMRLSTMFSRGQFGSAETLARRIVKLDASQPVPYAILGDVARSRGDLAEAAKMYAYAVQMDPGNSTYQRRHEELLNISVAGVSAEVAQKGVPALLVGFGMVLLAGIYLALSKEAPLFSSVSQISSWTLGLLVMTFLSGVIIGSCLAIGDWLDRFNSTATRGRIAPHVALATVAIVSFWVASVLYFILGSTQKSFNVSTSRLVGGVAAGVLILTACAAISPSLAPAQVLLWGGNVMYMGSLSGWFVSDSFRRAA